MSKTSIAVYPYSKVVAYLADIGTIYQEYCRSLLSGSVLEEQERSIDSIGDNSVKRAETDPAIISLMAQCLLDMIKIDQSFGGNMLDSLSMNTVPVFQGNYDWYDSFVRKRRGEPSLRDFWSRVEFSMDMQLSEEEKEITDDVFRTVNECLILSRDYWSWERDNYLSKKHGTGLYNVVEVLRRTEWITLERAQWKVKEKIINLERQYLRQKYEFYREYPEESKRLRRWIEVAGNVIAGYHYWASKCPYYHAFDQDGDASSDDVSAACVKQESETSTPSPNDVSADSVKQEPGISTPSPNETNPAEILPDTGIKRPLTPTADDSAGNESTNKRVKSDWMQKKLDPVALMAPCEYASNLSSKDFTRSRLTEALNVWSQAPASSIDVIERIMKCLHDASIILTDFENNSSSNQKGFTTHNKFGSALEINSASFMFVQAASEAQKLQNPEAIQVLLAGLEHFHLGKGWDLLSKRNLTWPDHKEYFKVLDSKKGAKLQMLARLLCTDGTENSSIDLDRLMGRLARFLQIRDDYMCFTSVQDRYQKGFCEGLEKMKYSYPIIRFLNPRPYRREGFNAYFRQWPSHTPDMPLKNKIEIFDLLKGSDTFGKTLQLLKQAETEIEMRL